VVDRGTSQGDIEFGRVVHSTIRRAMTEMKKGNLLRFEEVQRIYETNGRRSDLKTIIRAGVQKDGLEQLRTFHAAVLKALPEILEQEKGSNWTWRIM